MVKMASLQPSVRTTDSYHYKTAKITLVMGLQL